MNRYEKHLNERLEQKSPLQQFGLTMLELVATALYAVFLIALNLVFFMVVIWGLSKFLGG